MAELWSDKRFCSAACNTAVLQDLFFVCRLDYLHLKSNHAKFQLNLIRNGWVMVRLEIVQRCMEYCSAAGSMFCLQTSSFPSSCKISAHSVRKWLWYSQYKHLLLMGGWVGWDRKVIIKSSRTFNPKFLTQSFSRLKFFCNTNFFVTYNFLGLKFFGPKLFWDPNIFRMRIFFKTKNFLQPKFFGTIWNR